MGANAVKEGFSESIAITRKFLLSLIPLDSTTRSLGHIVGFRRDRSLFSSILDPRSRGVAGRRKMWQGKKPG